MRKRRGAEQAGGKLPLLADGALTGRSFADQPLHQPEQEREEEFEPLAVAAKSAKPLGEPVHGGPVKLRQPGEGREDVAVKRDALPGGKLKRASNAALAELERDGKRLGVDLVLIATEGEKAIDVFHITKGGSKLTEAEQQALTSDLHRTLEGSL